MRARLPLLLVLVASPVLAEEEVTVTTAESDGERPLPVAEAGLLEGGGVRVSDGLYFHPSAEVSTAYQTNVFYQDAADPGGVVGAPLLLIGVGGALQTQAARSPVESTGAAPRVALKSLLDLTWHQYLSSQPYISEQNDLGIGALIDATFNPQGELAFRTKAGYTRAVRPPPAYTDADVVRDKLELGLGAVFKPGGGAIQALANYTFGLDIFEDTMAASYGNRLSNTFALGAKWQWLPKTQYTFETSFGIVSPSNTQVSAGSMPLRVNLGVATLITPPFGVVLRAGYGNNFSSGVSYNSYLALAEARYALGPTLRFAGGYSHDFQDALIGDFYSDHAFYARTSMAFMGRVQVRGKAELRIRTWEGIDDLPEVTFSSSTRSDLIVRVELGGDYQINPWLLVGAGWILESDMTNFGVTPTTGVGGFNSAAYNWNEVRVNATAKF